MKKYLVLILLMSIGASTAFAEIGKTEAVDKAKAMVRELGMGLKKNLQMAMKEGGPVNAIPVCKAVGQSKAVEVSRKHGAFIHRVSLKLRNSANAPDTYETKVLRQMENDLAKGELKLAYVVVEEKGGEKNLRFMKPIVTSKVCTRCHGALDGISPEVIETLKKEYPDDKATGYKVGVVRGAFSVVYPMD